MRASPFATPWFLLPLLSSTSSSKLQYPTAPVGAAVEPGALFENFGFKSVVPVASAVPSPTFIDEPEVVIVLSGGTMIANEDAEAYDTI